MGEIQVHEFMSLDGVIDELHLLVYPLTRGDGPRLFEGGDVPRSFAVKAAEPIENGVLYLNYAPIHG